MKDFQIELGEYTGPLDLLLYLTRVNELDITDIPIAVVTEQFLRYIDLIDMLNMDLGSDFIVMASTLMEIKSRTLVPVDDADEEEAMEDPRLELIQQLIEYKKVKETAKDLDKMAEEHSLRFPRVVKKTVVEEDYSLDTVDLWDLVTAFDKIIKQVAMPASMEIVDDDVPIQVYMDQLIEKLSRESPIAFEMLFEDIRDKAKLIGTFLAILELVRQHKIKIEQEERFGNIMLEYVGDEETLPES